MHLCASWCSDGVQVLAVTVGVGCGTVHREAGTHLTHCERCTVFKITSVGVCVCVYSLKLSAENTNSSTALSLSAVLAVLVNMAMATHVRSSNVLKPRVGDNPAIIH
jgi:hypothetical protein